MQTILVTGGAGFIGGCFVRRAVAGDRYRVINLDALTYAGNLDSLPPMGPQHFFERGDIGDQMEVARLLNTYQPDAVLNFAAESHVDRSIDGPKAFLETNVMGTFGLLQTTLHYWNTLPPERQRQFRFLHVSTDEVFGSLAATGRFDETTPYAPHSPYSASKAASAHLVRAWAQTYGLPVLVTNCSNNYGPYQFPEKLIPLMTLNALAGKPLPIYGDGGNVRDWLFVEDHCRALELILQRGTVGETYAIGGDCERTNREIVDAICDAVEQVVPTLPHACRELIRFVPDRPGHDRRYAIDASKLKNELGWYPETSFADGIRQTVRWYVNHPQWVARIASGGYRGQRLGVLPKVNA
jgi:dTDP-glucose 4,6-dehydratase